MKKLRKENQEIKVKPTTKEFTFTNKRKTYPEKDTPKTVKTFMRLYSRGFKDAYIDFKMLLPLAILGIVIMAFIVF